MTRNATTKTPHIVRKAVLLATVLVGGMAVLVLIAVQMQRQRTPAAPKIGPLESWGIAVRTNLEKDPIEFELYYGRDVTGIYRFEITDASGKPLWKVYASGQNALSKITYSVTPIDPNYTLPQQQFPENNRKPAGIRGQKLHLRVEYRVTSWFGPGTHIYDEDIDVPKG